MTNALLKSKRSLTALLGGSLGVFALALASAGCIVRVYQPLSGLHRPIVVNPQLPNFQGVRLTVRCLPGDLLNAQEAGALCEKVARLFENQGAEVHTTDSMGPADDTGSDRNSDTEADDTEDADAEAAPEEEPTDLTVELRARKLHVDNDFVSWVLCLSSFTVLPGVSENEFAQDVSVRDASGFLLASESLEGRIVQRFGFGPWLGNKILDLTVRDPEEELTGTTMNRDLSSDLYGQLSQVVFNAKMQWDVLQQVPTAGGPR